MASWSLHRPCDDNFDAFSGLVEPVVTMVDFGTAEVDVRSVLLLDDTRALHRKRHPCSRHIRRSKACPTPRVLCPQFILTDRGTKRLRDRVGAAVVRPRNVAVVPARRAALGEVDDVVEAVGVGVVLQNGMQNGSTAG